MKTLFTLARKPFLKTLCVASFAASALAPPAVAQTMFTSPMDLSMSSYVYSTAAATLTQDAYYDNDDGQKISKETSANPVSLQISASKADAERVAKRLASHFPAAHQADAEAMYLLFFNTYEENYPKTFPGAVGALLAGSYAAYHNQEIPDEHSLAVITQFDELLQSAPEGFNALSEDMREEAYIEMIMLGMQLFASAIKNQQGGDAEEIARQKQAGAQHLQALLNTSPQNVHISAQGFTLR